MGGASGERRGSKGAAQGVVPHARLGDVENAADPGTQHQAHALRPARGVAIAVGIAAVFWIGVAAALLWWH